MNIIYGSTNGLTSGGGTTGVPASQIWHQNRSVILDDSEAGDRFGSALAAGDFNGDGVSDLAIGVPSEDSVFGTNGIAITSPGAVQVLFGSTLGGLTGLTATGNQIFRATDFSLGVNLFGSSLAWGDFNGDGVGDLAIGQPGAVFILRGSASGLTATNFQRQNFPPTAVALAAGKFNADTRSDLAVGISGEDVLTSHPFAQTIVHEL